MLKKDVQVLANVDNVEMIGETLESGACGVGLVRTETNFYEQDFISKFYPLLIDDDLDQELLAEFKREYCKFLDELYNKFVGKRVVIRLFDFRFKDILRKVTIKKYGSTPCAAGVQDQFKSESYSYNQYTNPERAYQLRNQIELLDTQIKTYAQRARAEREEALVESRIPKYDYVSAGVAQTSHNPAIAARYNAQQRFFGMNKLQQTIMKITDQKRNLKDCGQKQGVLV